ncbi:hypothetical protein DFH28DRAFT_1123668 [Melampsora americana]|nr:hypothetical protein DFH28DRAFT_1123668 [Melampsora americana]
MPTLDNGTQSAQESPNVSTASIQKCEWTGDQESKMIDLLTKVHQSKKSVKGFTKVTWALIAKELKGTEGDTKLKTGEMCLSHYNASLRRASPP